MRKARIFISCGQKTDREKQFGKNVCEYFQKRGFDTYFAEEINSPDAITVNVFNYLKCSEYFVFIDFKSIFHIGYVIKESIQFRLRSLGINHFTFF